MKRKKFLNLVLSLGVILLLSGDTAYSASQSTGPTETAKATLPAAAFGVWSRPSISSTGSSQRSRVMPAAKEESYL